MSPQPRRSAPSRSAGPGRERTALADMRDRELGRDIGACERCGQPVRSQQGFMREDGAIAHVRCGTTDPATPRARP